MLDEVRRYIKRENLLLPGEPVHVAVSGGIDSMVLLHVLRRLGHRCSVLHVDQDVYKRQALIGSVILLVLAVVQRFRKRRSV